MVTGTPTDTCSDFYKCVVVLLEGTLQNPALATKAKFAQAGGLWFVFFTLVISIVVVGRAAAEGLFHNGLVNPNRRPALELSE
jgi:hypothetical protein